MKKPLTVSQFRVGYKVIFKTTYGDHYEGRVLSVDLKYQKILIEFYYSSLYPDWKINGEVWEPGDRYWDRLIIEKPLDKDLICRNKTK